MNRDDPPSTRPYLIRALHQWCVDNSYTPYIAVAVDASVQVPREYVKNNEIVLNASFEAASQLTLGNEYIEFKARFGGVAREIVVPVDRVLAIYARENGQGMAFPVSQGSSNGDDEFAVAGSPPQGRAQFGAAPSLQLVSSQEPSDEDGDPPPTTPGRNVPALKRVK